MSETHMDGPSQRGEGGTGRALICRATADGILTFVNDAYCEALGHTRQELLGQSFWTFIPQHEHPRLREYLATLTPLEPAGTIEHVVHAATGEKWTQRWIDFARFDQGGRLVEWLSVGEATPREDTARTDEPAEASSREVQQEIPGLSPVAALGVLAGSIAHELNQPLTSIAANAQAALQFLESGQPDVDEVREALQDIGEENRRASLMIRRLVESLREGTAEHQPFDINAVVADVKQSVLHRAQARGVTIELQLAPGLARVLGDRAQMQQVLLNLLVNACEAVDTADLPSSRRHVIVRTQRSHRNVQVSVSDRGPGVSPEEANRIFEPFYTTKAHGMGLGLAICRSVVALHRGRLEVEPNEDAGATFSFTLKGVEAAARTATAAPG